MAEVEAPRLIFLVVMLLFFFLTPDIPQSSPRQRQEHRSKIDAAKEAYHDMTNNTYASFDPTQDRWLNLTGMRKANGFAWDMLAEVQDSAKQQLISIQRTYGEDKARPYDEARKIRMPLYQNVSGSVTGRFLKTKATQSPRNFNLSALVPGNDYVSHEFLRNVTEPEGEVTFRFVEEGLTLKDENIPSVSSITADTTIYTSSSPGSGWDVRLYGAHIHEAGLIILTTTSEKFDGIFALPQFGLEEEDFQKTKRLLNQSINSTINKWQKSPESLETSPWSSSAIGALFNAPACELLIYLQQHPIYLSPNQDDVSTLVSIEQEMRFPMGAPVPVAPPMTMSATIFSPDCGFILKSEGRPESTDPPNHLSGPRREMFWDLMRNLMLALIVVLGMQIALIKRQIDEASTPSTRSRISYQTIGLMALGDGLMASVLIGFLMINQSLFLLISTASFLCFFNLAIMEMRFIFDIWTVQVGDLLQRMRERERQQAQTAARQAPLVSAGNTQNPTGQDVRPANIAAAPVILPPDQEIETAAEEDERLIRAANPTTATPAANTPRRVTSDFGTIYARFYFTILGTVFMSIWAHSWPKSIRSAYVNVITFVYLSFWIPQIYRNTMRNCRKALRWEFVFGISICRLIPIIYCYAKERNTFDFDVNPSAAMFFVGWLWIQVLLLLSQQYLGPRLFVKEAWCPPAYDYHPILRDDSDDPEAGSTLPIGFVASASEAKEADNREKSKSGKVFDCAICMQEIEVPVVSKNEGEGRGASWLGRMGYMVTPCRHIFHSQCLEGWMRLRLVCPICREGLPPI